MALTFQVLGRNAILITFKCRDPLQLHFHTELFIFQPLIEWDFIIPVSLFQYFYLFAWRSESWFCLIVHLFINSCSWYSVAVWTNRSFKLSDNGKKVTIYNNSLKSFCLLLVLNLTYCHTEYLASFLQWFHPLQSDSSALFCSEQSRTGIQHHIDMLQTQAAVGRGKALVSLDYSYLRYLKIWRKTLLKILLRVGLISKKQLCTCTMLFLYISLLSLLIAFFPRNIQWKTIFLILN